MSDPWKFASIDSFEQVTVAGPTRLLRVGARTSQPDGGDAARPTLVADDGETVSSFAAIPSPPETGETLRAAYAVPAKVVTPDTVFSLEFPDFFVIALPAPSEGATRVAAAAAAPRTVAAPTQERRSDLPPKLTELTEELAGTRHEAGELRTAAQGAQAEAEETRSQLLHLHVTAAVQSAELEAVRDLAALGAGAGASPVRAAAPVGDDERSAEVDDLRIRLQVAEHERDDARRAQAQSESDHARTQERLSELEVWSGELERRLAQTTTELADIRVARPEERLRTLERDAVADAHAAAERDLAVLADPSA